MSDDHHDHDHRPTIYHMTSPMCHWSWGYEPALNRIRLVYGEQVPINLLQQSVYETVDEWFTNYGMNEGELLEWGAEIRDAIGLPIRLLPKARWPASTVPATLAVFAALRQDPVKANRLSRAFLRRFAVAGEDVTQERILLECVREAGLDVARFQKDWSDQEALKHAWDNQGEGVHWPHVPLNFYNVVVSDGHRHVILEHAFDPATIEDAIDWIGGGKLRKSEPTDIGAYLAHHGPASKEEIATVFRLAPEKAEAALADLEKQGRAAATTIGDATFWGPKGK